MFRQDALATMSGADQHEVPPISGDAEIEALLFDD